MMRHRDWMAGCAGGAVDDQAIEGHIIRHKVPGSFGQVAATCGGDFMPITGEVGASNVPLAEEWHLIPLASQAVDNPRRRLYDARAAKRMKVHSKPLDQRQIFLS